MEEFQKSINGELKMAKRILNFCVGVLVGDHNLTNFPHLSKDAR